MRIDVQDISFSYGPHTVLNHISCRINSGEILCIVGPNGSGKSTLAKCMDGLLTPRSGTILLQGTKHTDLSPVERARIVGYVPQSPSPGFSTTVFETVMMGRRPHGAWRTSREDIHKVARVIRQMDLEQEALRDINQLSGGQRQRVFIARALAQEPRALILDEPTSALDMAHQLDTMKTLRALTQAQGLSVTIILHDLNLAARYGDRILMLDKGNIHAMGKPETVFTPDNLARVYGIRTAIRTIEGCLSILPLGRCTKSAQARANNFSHAPQLAEVQI